MGFKISALSAAVALAVLVFPDVTSADVHVVKRVVYEAKRGEERPRVSRHKLWVSGHQARLEQEEDLYLLDTVAGELIHVNLGHDHYYKRPSPNTLESQTPPMFLDQAREQWAEKTPDHVEVRHTGERERIAGYDTELIVIEAGGAGEPVTARMELWVSEELGQRLKDTALNSLHRDRMLMTPYTSWLVGLLGENPPYPVRSRVHFALAEGALRTEYTSTLVSFEEDVSPPEGTYEVPEGYELAEDDTLVVTAQ